MTVNSKVEQPKIGIYKHFKGNNYLVLGLARHSETEEPMVVYRCLYGEFDVWVRPLSLFLKLAQVNDEPVDRFAFERDATVDELNRWGLAPVGQ
jgi:hypothetical protein